MLSEAVMITHDNITWTANAYVQEAGLVRGVKFQHHVISYLPLR